jgi:hypothetical protein
MYQGNIFLSCAYELGVIAVRFGSVLTVKAILTARKKSCGSVWFGWFLKHHPNQTKPNQCG